MATGRRDYTAGFLIETQAGSRYTQNYTSRNNSTCVSGLQVNLWDYIVPEKYRLAINRMSFFVTPSCFSRYTVLKDDVIYMYGRFSEQYDLVMSDQNPVYFTEGTHIELYIRNDDVMTTFADFNVFGILEHVRD